jgi:aspartate aminotransferase
LPAAGEGGTLGPVQRIEAGSLRGRRLLPLPAGVPGLRPTGARVRGAIFDRLQDEVRGARVLDLFAGSGALSIEALSRGAAGATMLELDARVARHLRHQLEVLSLASRAQVVRADALAWLRAGRGNTAPYDLVLVDPPFALPHVFEPIAQALVDGDWLAEGAWIVCERERVRGTTTTVAWPAGLVLERARDYGQARLELLRRRGDFSPEAHAMQAPISTRAARIKPSATLAVLARAGELRAAGHRILNFSAGEPDFAPPSAVTRAVTEAAQAGPIHYAPVPGTPALRDAVARHLSEVHGRQFERAEIFVSCGAKHSLVNLFLAMCNPGDEVVIPAPYWVSYPDMAGLAEATPVIVPTTRQDGWRMRPEALEAALSDRTTIIVLNSPSNPTGAGYREEDLVALGEVILAKAPQAFILSDDIYRELCYDGFRYVSPIRAFPPELAARVVAVDGVSKTYAMTGYRIGYFAGPKALVAAAQTIQGQMTSGPATLSLHAALAALTDPSVPAEVAAMKEAFTRRRTLVLDGLRQVPGVEVLPPNGAFYVFIDASRYTGPKARHADDVALAKWLLEDKQVAIVPGTPFGAPGHLRMSYATDDASLTEGLARLADAFGSLA